MRSAKPITALAIALLILASTHAVHAVTPGKSFEDAGVIDLSTGSAEIKGSLLDPLQNDHYYALVNLTSGTRIRLEITLMGVKSAYVTASLYASNHARLVGYDAPLGSGSKKELVFEYSLAYNPEEPTQTLYLRFGKSRGAFNYTARITRERVDDLASGRDAGDSPEWALQTPKVTKDSEADWIGYLSEKDEGNDFEDYYQIPAKLDPGDVLLIKITPSKDLRIRANLLSSDLFPLRSNSCKARGRPITLRLTGDWKGQTYTFYLTIANFEGVGGGGEYRVEALVQKSANATATQGNATTPTPPQGPEESAIKLGIIAGAIALIAISIAALILRRRRLHRVEEVGWWGSEGGW